MSYGEDIELRVMCTQQGFNEFEQTLEGMQGQVRAVNGSVTDFNQKTEEMSINLREGNEVVTEAARRVSGYMISTRVLSRDLMTVGYSFNYLNRELFGHNQILQDVITTLILFGAVLRVVAVIQNLSAWFGAASTAASVFTWVQKLLNIELAQTAFWTAVITGGAIALVGLGVWAGLQAAQPRGTMQFGGVVPETGTYLLHRGETVTPAGGPRYSWINVNMYTGPISSSMDLGRIADELASRVTIESRRRGIF